MPKRIVTISREFGSGGRTIGKMVADRLGWSFYDKELIEQVSKRTGLHREFIEDKGEQATSQFAYYFLAGAASGVSMADYLWQEQRQLILELAEKGSCVIVGRCADHILRERDDTLNALIYADPAWRAKRIVEVYGETEQHINDRIRDKDKKRRANYHYYTDQKWGLAKNHHICLDSGLIGIDRCAGLLADLARAL